MSFTRLGTGGAATGTSTFGAKPVASTASASTATPPQKLTYEQLDANTKKLVDEVQYPHSPKHGFHHFSHIAFSSLFGPQHL